MTIKNLMQGYQEFRHKYFDADRSLFDALVKYGQQPTTMVIACSDSRVDPAIVLNCKPGDLFSIRNIANLIPPYEEDNGYHGISAAIEFGVRVLKVNDIIIFGHSQCGGIRSLAEMPIEITNTKNFINKWIELAKPTYNMVNTKYPETPLTEKLEICSKYSLVNSLQNLETFPWIKDRIMDNTISLHAWYFDLTSGTIHVFDKQKNIFLELS